MERLIKYLKCFPVFTLLMFNPLNAQISEDSLMQSAMMYVYDDPDKAIEIGESLIKSNENNPEKLISIYLMLSNSYSSKRDYERSLQETLKAKEIASKLKNPTQEFKILVKIAAQYHSLSVNDKALEILEEADRIFEKTKDKKKLLFDMGSNYAIKGFIYSDQLSCDIAIDYFNKALRTYSESDMDIDRIGVNQSVVSYNKGNCFINLNQPDSAKASFMIAKEKVKDVEAVSLRAFSMRGLAEIYTIEGNYDLALNELIEADSLAGNVGDLELNSGIYRGLADNYLAKNDWDNFRKYDNLYNTTVRQLRQSERNTINNILSDYNREISEKEKSGKLKYLILISVFGLLFLGTLFSIVRSEILFRNEFGKIKSRIKL